MTLKARLQRLESGLKPSEQCAESTRSGIVAKLRLALGLREDEPLPPAPEYVDPEALRAFKAALHERLAQCRAGRRR